MYILRIYKEDKDYQVGLHVYYYIDNSTDSKCKERIFRILVSDWDFMQDQAREIVSMKHGFSDTMEDDEVFIQVLEISKVNSCDLYKRLSYDYHKISTGDEEYMYDDYNLCYNNDKEIIQFVTDEDVRNHGEFFYKLELINDLGICFDLKKDIINPR